MNTTNLRQIFVSFAENENLSAYEPQEFADRMMKAVEWAEKGEIRAALESLIATLEPAVDYTGVNVIWSAEDRKATKDAIREAREVLKKYESS